MRRARNWSGAGCAAGDDGAGEIGGDGGCVWRSAGESGRQVFKAEGFGRPDRCDARAEVCWLRRIQAGDGLPEAGGCGDLCDAAGVSVGAFSIRDCQGAERVYGEAAIVGWGGQPPIIEAGGGGDGQEFEGGRGIDVAARPADAGDAEAHRRWRDWRHRDDARLSDARAGRRRLRRCPGRRR